MKILKIIFISFFVLLLMITTAFFIFIKTFDVERFKPQILEAMNQALGRPADFKDIDLHLSLTRGVSLDLKQFIIKDDPSFSSGELLKIDDISLGMDVLAYLSKRQITVSHIRITRPQLMIIRSKEGQINAATLGKPPAMQPPANPSPQTLASGQNTPIAVPDTVPAVKPAQPSQPLTNLPEIIIHSIDVQNANLTYIDKSFDPLITLEFSKLDLKLRNFSLKNPFSFHAEGSLLSAGWNVWVDGTGVLNLEDQSVQFKNIEISSDLSLFSFAKLQSSVSALKGVEMPEELSGKLSVMVDHLQLSAKGLKALLAQGELSRGNLKFKQLACPISTIEGKFQITESKINLNGLSAKCGKGSLSATGSLEDYLGKQNFTADLKLDSIDLSEILESKDQHAMNIVKPPPVKVEGIVHGNFTAKGQGFTAESLEQSLSGGGNLEVKNGRLKDINILKLVLSNISMLPGLADKMEETLPQNYKDKLTQKDTILNKAALTTTLQNGAIMIQPAEVEADGFLFSAEGTAGFDQSYSLDGSFFIAADLSAGMVAAVEELQYLLNDQQRIFIPLKIQGKGSQIKVFPDMEYLGKKIFMKRGRNELDKALDKVFDKGENGSSEKGPERQIIENILDNIFK